VVGKKFINQLEGRNNMTIQIHGKEYVTVAERVKSIHDTEKQFDITTELLNDNPVVIKATVKTEKGTFTGISSANPAKAIEKTNPYEVAETSAVGRALGFANYGLNDSIASADEMVKATNNEPTTPQKTVTTQPSASEVPSCPKCSGEMWDNRLNKKNPKAPDFKCKDNDCLDNKGYVTAIWHEHKETPEIDINEVNYPQGSGDSYEDLNQN
jgi:hypothetical protein